jgi:hypothetical protein
MTNEEFENYAKCCWIRLNLLNIELSQTEQEDAAFAYLKFTDELDSCSKELDCDFGVYLVTLKDQDGRERWTAAFKQNGDVIYPPRVGQYITFYSDFVWVADAVNSHKQAIGYDGKAISPAFADSAFIFERDCFGMQMVKHQIGYLDHNHEKSFKRDYVVGNASGRDTYSDIRGEPLVLQDNDRVVFRYKYMVEDSSGI